MIYRYVEICFSWLLSLKNLSGSFQDEDAYLRDFIRAVEHKDIDYVKFVVPIIKVCAQMSFGIMKYALDTFVWI